jgi:STE24 endopeptidase
MTGNDAPVQPRSRVPSEGLSDLAGSTGEAAGSHQAMPPEQLAEAREYGRQKLVDGLADMGLDVAVLAVAAGWLGRPLDAWLQPYVPSDVLRLLAMVAILFVLHLLVSFPLSYHTGYVLEHRYKLSTQSFGRWLIRFLGRSSLAALFGALLVVGLYEIIWHCGAWWWLVAAGTFFVVSVVLGQLFPVLILPLFYKVDRLEQPELTARLENLAAGTGLTLAGVYRLGLSVETSKANAMLTGVGRTRRVLLGDTLLDQFTPEEIEVIFAHEVGHHVFHHIPKMIAEGLAISMVGFWLCDRAMMAWVHHFSPGLERSELPIWALPAIMFIMTLFGMLLGPLQNTISRARERQCDRYALERTGKQTAYRSAFSKLARLNKSDPNPHPWEVALLHSHPPIAERIALADGRPG